MLYDFPAQDLAQTVHIGRREGDILLEGLRTIGRHK